MEKQEYQEQQKFEITTQSTGQIRISKSNNLEIQSFIHLKAQPMSSESDEAGETGETGEAGEQMINNDKQRWLCENPGQYPFSAIGVLYVFFSDFVSFGTAFLISSNILLTAAHNIYNRKSQKAAKQAKQAKLVMEFHDNKKTFRAVCAYFPKQYKQKKITKEASQFDYAIVILESIDIISAQKYRLITLSCQMKQGDQVQVYGYPDNLSKHQFYEDQKKYYSGKSTKIPKQKSLFGCKEQLKEIGQRIMLHGVPTSKGQSGSPVLRFNKKSKRYEAIGVHIHRLDASKGKGALRITGEVFNRINKWIQDFWHRKDNDQCIKLFDDKDFQIIKGSDIKQEINNKRKVKITPDRQSYGFKKGNYVIDNKNSNVCINNTYNGNWLCSFALPFDGEFVFTIKVIKLTQWILIGVMEEGKKGEKMEHTYNYSVFLDTYNQWIHRPNEEQTEQQRIKCSCSDQLPKCPFQIECHVNRQQNTIAWHYDGKQQAKQILPKAWKTNKKQLCAIVYVWNKGDSVQMM